MDKSTQRILRVSHLGVRFGVGLHSGSAPEDPASTIAVSDVSFDIYAGQRFALVGESGSGKTVTALSILKLLPDAQTTGQILWTANGDPEVDLACCSDREIRSIRGREIAMIFQEPMSALNPLFSVGQQIAEVLETHEGLSRRAAFDRAVTLLDRTGIEEPQRRANAFPHQLSGGQRQRAVIAMALACNPKLLIADEPTTALDVTIREQVLELLLQIQREDGMAVLLITHDLPLVARFADAVGVMQQGLLVEHKATNALFASPEHEYTRRLLSSRPQRMVSGTVDSKELMSAHHLRCQFNIPLGWWKKREFIAVDDCSLRLNSAETLGIVGESGSGKTTLALALLRLSAAEVSGEVTLDDQSITQASKADLRRLRRHMQIVFQDPFSALSPRMTIGQILEEGLKLHFPEMGRVDRDTRLATMLREVGLPEDCVSRYPHEFSGGQRQRIAIARAVILQPNLIVLDEPTSALDVSVQQQVLELLVKLQRVHAMAYCLITHDLAVIRAMAHRVIVMHQGKIVESGPTVDVLDRPQAAYTQQLINAAFATDRFA